MKIPIPKVKVPKLLKNPKLEIDRTSVKYQPYLVDLNSFCTSNNTDIFLGRDKEIRRIFDIILKTDNPNAILLGNSGVGKTSTVLAAINKIQKNNCPDLLKGCTCISWNLEHTLAKLANEDRKSKESIKKIFEYLNSKKDIILIIDQIHLMGAEKLLIYYLSILLENPNVKIIGMSTEKEFYGFFSDLSKILSSFDVITIDEPRSEKIYPMIKEYIHLLEKAHNVTISEELVKYCVSVSSAFPSSLSDPGLTTNFIERSMIVAYQAGHKSVTKKDINSNFNFDYDMYNKMSMDDKEITAYHEAGHFIVSKKSENIRNYKTTAITIIPSDYFLGVTTFEFQQEKQTSCDSDYFIDSIAVDLAGRVAETILQKNKGADISKATSGAYSDLKNATQTARQIVTEFGMLENCGQNMTYFCNYDMSDFSLLSEDRKKIIDEETQKLIDQAYKRAEKILTENIELLHLVAKELLANEVLDEKDLDRLCAKVLDKD